MFKTLLYDEVFKFTNLFTFRHPVVEIFLDVKWKKVRKVFVSNFLVYCIFLLSYSLFLGNIFYRQDDSRRLGNVKISDLVRYTLFCLNL